MIYFEKNIEKTKLCEYSDDQFNKILFEINIEKPYLDINIYLFEDEKLVYHPHMRTFMIKNNVIEWGNSKLSLDITNHIDKILKLIAFS